MAGSRSRASSRIFAVDARLRPLIHHFTRRAILDEAADDVRARVGRRITPLGLAPLTAMPMHQIVGSGVPPLAHGLCVHHLQTRRPKSAIFRQPALAGIFHAAPT